MAVLVGREAPDFTASAVLPDGKIVNNFKLSDLRGKYINLFFWPLDFTFVCPTEIIAHSHRLPEFSQRGVEVVGVSIDSPYVHLAWRRTPIEDGGIGEVGFTMVSDLSHDISRSYDVLHPEEGVAMRASFLIDRNGIVQHQIVNNLPLGRNIDEMLRMIDALQFFEEHGEVCPANWEKGQEALKPSPEGVKEYLSKNAANL